MKSSSLLLTLMIACGAVNGQPQQLSRRIAQLTDSFCRAVPAAKGIVVSVISPDLRLSVSIAAGVSDTVSMRPLSASQPVLTASSTKTYVAASILRLQEEHRLSIEQSIAELLPPATLSLMRSAGYAPDAIRVKHLLSHSSGIDDYVDAEYFDTVDRDRQRHWTREEQIRLAMLKHKPLGAPETRSATPISITCC